MKPCVEEAPSILVDSSLAIFEESEYDLPLNQSR